MCDQGPSLFSIQTKVRLARVCRINPTHRMTTTATQYIIFKQNLTAVATHQLSFYCQRVWLTDVFSRFSSILGANFTSTNIIFTFLSVKLKHVHSNTIFCVSTRSKQKCLKNIVQSKWIKNMAYVDMDPKKKHQFLIRSLEKSFYEKNE